MHLQPISVASSILTKHQWARTSSSRACRSSNARMSMSERAIFSGVTNRILRPGGVGAQAGHDVPGLLVVLRAAQVAALYARLLQMEHLPRCHLSVCTVCLMHFSKGKETTSIMNRLAWCNHSAKAWATVPASFRPKEVMGVGKRAVAKHCAPGPG